MFSAAGRLLPWVAVLHEGAWKKNAEQVWDPGLGEAAARGCAWYAPTAAAACCIVSSGWAGALITVSLLSWAKRQPCRLQGALALLPNFYDPLKVVLQPFLSGGSGLAFLLWEERGKFPSVPRQVQFVLQGVLHFTRSFYSVYALVGMYINSLLFKDGFCFKILLFLIICTQASFIGHISWERNLSGWAVSLFS